jgi:hypothetical protein
VPLLNGTIFGRPKVTVTEEVKEAYASWKSGEISAVNATQELSMQLMREGTR